MKLAGPETFGLATATSATVALWAGGGEENIPGGPPALPVVCQAPPRPAPSGLRKPRCNPICRGQKLSFAAKEGTTFGHARSIRTWPREAQLEYGSLKQPRSLGPGLSLGPALGDRLRMRTRGPGIQLSEAVSDSPSGPELGQALLLRGSLAAYTSLLNRRALRWALACTQSPGL